MLKTGCVTDFNNTLPLKVFNTISIDSQHHVSPHVPVNDNCLKERSDTSKRNQACNIYLTIGTIRKIIRRFLIEKGMIAAQLAEILEIGKKDFERLMFQDDLPPTLIPRVNLPLIRLYCETKFDVD